MHRLCFYGYSDDTFGEYGVTGDDIDNCGNCEPIQCVIDCGQNGRLMVIGQYSRASAATGCWMVGVSKVDEYDEWPDWAISTESCKEVEYSPKLVIDIPAGRFEFTWYKNGEKVGKTDI